jgi:[ribulose-bisphosphate carboxylase]/[fructose-bisphosphate aldolase]-lysine N-methyltransferase
MHYLRVLSRIALVVMQGGYVLTLTIAEDAKFYDDKVDILEGQGLGPSSSFTLTPDQEPSEDMMAFLRLMHLRSE